MNWLLAGWTLTSPPMPKFFQSIASPPKPRKKPLRLGVPAHVPPVAVGEPTGVHWPFVPGRVLSMPLELALSCAVPKPIMKSTELCALANGAHSNRRERMGRYRQIRFTSEVLLYILAECTNDSLGLELLSPIGGGFGPQYPTTLLEGKTFQGSGLIPSSPTGPIRRRPRRAVRESWTPPLAVSRPPVPETRFACIRTLCARPGRESTHWVRRS